MLFSSVVAWCLVAVVDQVYYNHPAKENFKNHFSKTKQDHIENLAVFNDMLTLYQFNFLELLKFIMRSSTKSRGKVYISELFGCKTSNRSTSRSDQTVFKVLSLYQIVIHVSNVSLRDLVDDI